MKIDDQGNLVLSSSKADNVGFYFYLLQLRGRTNQDCGRILKLPSNDIPYPNSIHLISLITTGKNFQTVSLLPRSSIAPKLT